MPASPPALIPSVMQKKSTVPSPLMQASPRKAPPPRDPGVEQQIDIQTASSAHILIKPFEEELGGELANAQIMLFWESQTDHNIQNDLGLHRTALGASLQLLKSLS